MCGVDSSGLGFGYVVGVRIQSNAPADFVKGEKQF